MSSRGSSLSRIINWFKEAEIEEALYVETRVVSIMAGRKAATDSKAVAGMPLRSQMTPHERALKAAESRKRNRQAKADAVVAAAHPPRALDAKSDFETPTQHHAPQHQRGDGPEVALKTSE